MASGCRKMMCGRDVGVGVGAWTGAMAIVKLTEAVYADDVLSSSSETVRVKLTSACDASGVPLRTSSTSESLPGVSGNSE